MSAVVVFSILERDADATLRRVAEAPAGCGLVEIRADTLRAGDLEGLVSKAGRPVVVTVRTPREGGFFDGSEEERRAILERALQAGASFVDVEWEGPLASLAAGPNANRIILSHHGAPCTLSELISLYRAMSATQAARLKIVPRCGSADQAASVRGLLRVAAGEGKSLACFATGGPGAPTRILAPSWGSWATYGSAGHGLETAEGQLPATDLLDVYDVLAIRPDTRRFALVGNPVAGSPSPAMHVAGYREIGLDARYLPLQATGLDEIVPLVGSDGVLGIEAFGVTVPFKEEAARRSMLEDPCSRISGAVNTVLVEGEGRWRSYNTDGPAALALIRRHVDPDGTRAAVIGAGGTARAIGAVLCEAGAHVTFFNRDLARAERAAAATGGRAESIDVLVDASWEILCQATPLGRDGEEVIPQAGLCGRLVLDVVYGAGPTPLVLAARQRGLAVVEGLDLLTGQAVLQFQRMTGRSPSWSTLHEAGRGWLAGRSPRPQGS